MQPTPTLYDYGTRDAWIAGRRSRVGASEVAILFGLAPESWGNPFTLWLEKTGRPGGRLEPTKEQEDWFDFGHEMEPVIAKLYERRTGRTLWTGGSQYTVAIDPDLPTLGGTPDRLVIDAPGMPGNGVLQIKNAGWYMMSDWETEIPQHVQLQIQAEMACTGLTWGSAAVALGGNTFRSYDLRRNQSVIDEIRATVDEFMTVHVKGDKPPPVDGSERTKKALAKLHPLDSGDEVALPAEAAVWLADWQDAKAAIATVERIEGKRKTEAENKLKAAIGGGTFGVLPDGRRLTLKTTAREGYEVAPVMYRTLRLESTKTRK